jgi:hypothetical protein
MSFCLSHRGSIRGRGADKVLGPVKEELTGGLKALPTTEVHHSNCTSPNYTVREDTMCGECGTKNSENLCKDQG